MYIYYSFYNKLDIDLTNVIEIINNNEQDDLMLNIDKASALANSTSIFNNLYIHRLTERYIQLLYKQ